MKPYPAYKDSGIEWLGKMPEHWKEIRLKYIGYLFGGLSGKSGSDFNNDENSNNKRFIPFTNIANNSKIDTTNLQLVHFRENETQNMVQRGDLFFLMSSENFDDVGKSAVLDQILTDVYLNSFCRGLRITDEEIDPIYLNYLLSCNPLRSKLIIGANGFTRINLKTEKIKDLSVLVPSLPEQTQIAAFLDHKTNQIDDLIAKKEKLIELLKEERTAVINQAVTKGLDPNVPMKDSGIEWLGEIPEHWEVKKIKYVAELKSGDGIKSEQIKPIAEYPVYGGHGLRGYFDDYTHDGDYVLIGRQGALCGNIKYTSGKIWASEHAVVVTISDNVNLIWIGELLRAMNLNQYSVSAAQPGLSVENIKNLHIPTPPSKGQNQIATYLNQKTKQITDSIEKMGKEIDLINEYRASLINEAVTGKIDVREYRLEESIEL